jgi:hypothetical protein
MMLDQLSIWDGLLLQGGLQLFILSEVRKIMKRKDYKQLIKIAAIDVALACLINLPFTGVGQASVADVQRAVNKVPDAFSKPFLLPPTETGKTTPDKYCYLLGNWGFYNKQIGFTEKPFYPVELKSSKGIYQGDSTSKFADLPFLFTTGNLPSDSIKINYFKGILADLTVFSSKTDTLVFQQNIYKHWRCVVNGEAKKPIKYKGVFNAVVIQPGKNYVKFYFNPTSVAAAYRVSKYAILLALIYLIIVMVKRVSP